MCQCVASSHPRCQAREVAPNRGGKEVTMVSRWTCVGGEEDISGRETSERRTSGNIADKLTQLYLFVSHVCLFMCCLCVVYVCYVCLYVCVLAFF